MWRNIRLQRLPCLELHGGGHVAFHNSLRDLASGLRSDRYLKGLGSCRLPACLTAHRLKANVPWRWILPLSMHLGTDIGMLHWDATCQAAGAACLAYAERKRAHNRTESFCEAAGVWYGNSRVAAHLRPGPFCIGFVEPLLSLQGLILAL